MKCHYWMWILNRLRRGQRFTNLLCLSSLVSLSLLSLSFSLLLLSLSSLTSLTPLHTLLTIFNMPCVINMLQTVRFPFTVVHTMPTMYAKLEWLVNRILSFSQSVHATYEMYTDYRPVWGLPGLPQLCKPSVISLHIHLIQHTPGYHTLEAT